MNREITLKSKSMTLIGRSIKKGKVASRFTATDTELKDVKLSDFEDYIKIITSFLSLDTPTCDLQVKEFNKQAQKLSNDIKIIAISQDLPFAQKRFCEANNIDKVITLSDYKDNSFGINYGLLIKEINLLARSVLIVDKNNIIRYIQVVQEASNPPDYEHVLNSLKDVLKNPSEKALQRSALNCISDVSTLSIDKQRIDYLCDILKDWKLIPPDRAIAKTIRFKDFSEVKYFVNAVNLIADEQRHHPSISVDYKKVTVSLTTHILGALSENDFIMAQIIDELLET